MTGPLDGVLVVDLTRALAGPHAAMMLGDLGARVVKVESPGSGDDTRGWGPPFVQPEGRPDPADRESTYFLAANRNKESITLDLKDDGDKALLTELLRRADVLLENFRPGTLARLGFGTDVLAELNPRLVTLAISGFGHDGPEGGRAGYDQIAQGEGGLMSVTGPGPDDPQRVGVPIGDLLAGMYGAYGVLAALLERERTGRGQVVRTSLLAAIVGVHALHGTAWTVAGQVGRAQGNHHPAIAPYGLFRCADGSVQVACANESLWRRLCAEFGFDPEAPGMATNGDRVGHREQVIALLEGAFASIGAEDLLARMNRIGIPAGKVRTLDEVYTWDQTLSQGLVVDVDHATLGPLRIPGPPLRFFAPGPDGETETTRRGHRAPPVLGADGAAIRAWLAAGGQQPAAGQTAAQNTAADGVPQPAEDDVEDGHAT
jgi:crotonobetainyl-CoA:carnitine CoA-transferase CaiB-like acyl-CoA transferase